MMAAFKPDARGENAAGIRILYPELLSGIRD
jgi:hypothetical protein